MPSERQKHKKEVCILYVDFICLWFRLLSGLTAILAKCGIQKTDSTAATAVRTIIVLIFSWIMVFIVGSQDTITNLSVKTWIFLILSGLSTGASWLCYYRALQDGPASVVVPIDKLSILVTIAFSYIVFKEKLSKKSGPGLLLIVLGTFLMIVPTLSA